ncbi:MAG: xanthine dehydrogenase family protein molybdopterin-binding subunit [Pseudomonadota bacterium]|nr:xanthine dehydrogenase family protein molybdopterin-binding subunit [Pseudomonadota bacterium]
MVKFGVGQGVPRWEDPRLLRGGGRYSDDINRSGQAYGHVVRSIHAHAVINSIDVAAARAAPGVLAVYTGKDYAASGLGAIPCAVPRQKPDGSPMFTPPNMALRTGRVRLVGDYVAFVVAETLEQACDAGELVEIDYSPLPSVTATMDATADNAASVWDECPDNVCFKFNLGDRAKTDAAFDAADHVTRLEMNITRVAVNPMENRACVAEYDKFDDRYTLYAGCQGPHGLRQAMAEPILKIPENRLRIVSDDMGGAFGMRSGPYCEYILCLWAAKNMDRPVKWTGDRTQGMMSDDHARDNFTTAELALDHDGKFLGLRIRTIANLGAYLTLLGPHSPTNNLGTLANTYTTPAFDIEITGVFTNTNSTGPYRGAGRPEAAYVIERVIDSAAREMDIDRAEIRRRNMIPESAMPYQTGLLFKYDCGQFEKNMDGALKMSEFDGFENRRTDARSQGKLRGIGIANAIEQSAGGPQETAQIRFDPSGSVTLIMGTHNHGQGHETIFRQMLSEKLGLEFEQIVLSQGDTDKVIAGTGTFGSRSSGVGGASIMMAADKIIDKCRIVAAHQLEAAEEDIEFENGDFTVAGTDRSVSLIDTAKAAQNFITAPPGMEPGLDEWSAWRPPAPTFPNGCHVCEVEIDLETGELDLLCYCAVDDVGTVINPLLLDGQVHGGIAQGVGQIVMENVVWDRESGQLIAGSFMDYAMPRADDFPNFKLKTNEVPSATNPMGVKGAGEAGCVGAMPALMNAIVDALAPIGIDSFDMPATPERLWQAIKHASA